MLATIGAVAAVNAIDKQQRKNNKPSFLDKKITKVCAFAIWPGAGQFLDGRYKTGAIHFCIGLVSSLVTTFGLRGMGKYLEKIYNGEKATSALRLAACKFAIVAAPIVTIVSRIVSAIDASVMSCEYRNLK